MFFKENLVKLFFHAHLVLVSIQRPSRNVCARPNNFPRLGGSGRQRRYTVILRNAHCSSDRSWLVSLLGCPPNGALELLSCFKDAPCPYIQSCYAVRVEAAESKSGCEMNHEGIQHARCAVVEGREGGVAFVDKEIPTAMRVAFPLLTVANPDAKLLLVQHEMCRMENDQFVLELGVVEDTLCNQCCELRCARRRQA